MLNFRLVSLSHTSLKRTTHETRCRRLCSPVFVLPFCSGAPLVALPRRSRRMHWNVLDAKWRRCHLQPLHLERTVSRGWRWPGKRTLTLPCNSWISGLDEKTYTSVNAFICVPRMPAMACLTQGSDLHVGCIYMEGNSDVFFPDKWTSLLQAKGSQFGVTLYVESKTSNAYCSHNVASVTINMYCNASAPAASDKLEIIAAFTASPQNACDMAASLYLRGEPPSSLFLK